MESICDDLKSNGKMKTMLKVIMKYFIGIPYRKRFIQF